MNEMEDLREVEGSLLSELRRLRRRMREASRRR